MLQIHVLSKKRVNVYQRFGLLVTSILGFKALVDAFTYVLLCAMDSIFSFRNATPVDHLMTNTSDQSLSHLHFHGQVGGWN